MYVPSMVRDYMGYSSDLRTIATKGGGWARPTHLTQRNGCGPGSGRVLCSFYQSQAEFLATIVSEKGPSQGRL
jgi:hypothetical protein